MCERDGSFDFGAYRALHDFVTWEEALRINAVLVVIGDERADYGEWRAKHDKHKGGGATELPALTFTDWKHELDSHRAELELAQATLQAHRRAVVTNASEGRLSDEDVSHFETIVDITSFRVQAIQGELDRLAAEAIARGEPVATAEQAQPQQAQHPGRGAWPGSMRGGR